MPGRLAQQNADPLLLRADASDTICRGDAGARFAGGRRSTMDLRPPVPERKLGPHPLTEDGVAALLHRYAFHDSLVRRVIVDQEWGPQGTRVVRLVIDARVLSEGARWEDLRWEPVSLDLLDVRRFRIDENIEGSWVLYDPPQFTRFGGLLQVDLCAERFGSLHPENAEEVFDGSALVFAATGGTWSALHPWAQ
ncbi:hypothetical protein AB0878_30045 [Amycolatopsis sp. NPDC047767]|uniref:hypothetical protein n=1 Tax=Amycolatopsis sp. NPDC047767 TaxID=3156765 RepID=UPI003455FCEA